jgi:uncharacterized protein (TIGR00369 family)
VSVDPAIAARFDAVPVNRHLGFALRAHDASGAEVAFTPRPEHRQEFGVVHGAILSALADTASVYAVLPGLAADERMTSIEFKVNFLAAARPDGGEIVGRSTMVRRGRTVAVVRTDVFQGDTHVVTGIFTYVILPASA